MISERGYVLIDGRKENVIIQFVGMRNIRLRRKDVSGTWMMMGEATGSRSSIIEGPSGQSQDATLSPLRLRHLGPPSRTLSKRIKDL